MLIWDTMSPLFKIRTCYVHLDGQDSLFCFRFFRGSERAVFVKSQGVSRGGLDTLNLR